jgi:hypothetical protein
MMRRYAAAADRSLRTVAKAVSGAGADVMTTRGQLVPAIKASGAILDPEIVLEAIAFGDDPPVVVHDTRLDLFGGQVVLLFTGSKFIPLKIPEPQDRFPYYPLWYFIKYRSRLNYNVVTPERLALDPASLSASTTVTFTLRRLVEVTREEAIAGETRRFWHHETEAHEISIEVRELEGLLQLCTPQLYFAIAYYLIGCEHPRYFLIEFFKAVEVIENAFGGESGAIDALREWGVARADLKKLKRYASEQQRPFDIGRHAPRGEDLRVIDVRRLLDEPLSRTVFRESVAATRQAIDAYFAYLRARGKAE